VLARAQDPGDPLYGNVQAVTGFCTDYVTLDVTQKPFDDLLVRQAFVRAIDKDRYNDVVWGGTGVLARGLYPPGLPGFTEDVSPPGYDAKVAAQELQKSSYGGAHGLPRIVFTTFGAGGNISSSDGLLIQMWKDALGVTVEPQGLDYDSYFDAIYSGKNGQIINSGWCADYADPESFADLFASGSLQNRGHYNNPEVEALLHKARSEPDAATRIKRYQELEQHIVDDAPAIFLTHSQTYYIVTRPNLKGFVATPIGVAENMNLWFASGN
jgi:ABC-type transport system substrate-binding protein